MTAASNKTVAKAFISGITGQDGFYLAAFLLAKGPEVHGIIRTSISIRIVSITSIQFIPPRKQCDTVFGMAHPWWVNLLITVPFISYLFWRSEPLLIARTNLLTSALFAASFGVVEGMVVVYLRAVLAAAAGYGVSLSAVALFSKSFNPAMPESAVLPVSVLKVEVCREAATMLMLITVAQLGTVNRPARWAMFLWTFAIWDLMYYATLCTTIRWPSSLANPDVLFLIPIPWISPVWFPLLVSTLCIAAVLQSRRSILREGGTEAG